MHGCSGGGACMVAPGEHGCSGGHAWLLQGVCMVALGGHAWLLRGGLHGCLGGMCGFFGGVRGFFDEIRSMSGRYASYWNAFLFSVKCIGCYIFSSKYIFSQITIVKLG